MAFLGKPTQVSGSFIWDGQKFITNVIGTQSEAVNGFAANFNSNEWQVVSSDMVYTVSGSTHGLQTTNLQIQLFQSSSNGFYLVAAQETLINSNFDVKFTISSGSNFNGKVILLKAGGVDNYWTDNGNLLFTTASVQVSGNISIGGQAFPVNTGSLTLTGSSLTTNLNNSNVHYHLLTSGGVSLSTASNQQPGGSYVWILRQDGTGGHSLTFDADYFTILGTNSSIITSSNKTTIVSGISDGSKIFIAIAGDES